MANLPTRPIRPIQPLCSDALRSLDVFCEKEITQTFVGYQGCTKDLLRIYQGQKQKQILYIIINQLTIECE